MMEKSTTQGLGKLFANNKVVRNLLHLLYKMHSYIRKHVANLNDSYQLIDGKQIQKYFCKARRWLILENLSH